MLNASGVLVTDTTHIGHINPHRYRGYYYDTETGLYYLKSRYCDPSICRFISMDDISFADPGSINGLNLYAYCGNNPVMYFDPNGNAFVSILIGLGIAALIGAGVGATTYAAGQLVSYAITGNFEWSWGAFAGSVIGGALAGALIRLFPMLKISSIFLTGVTSGTLTTAGSMVGQIITNEANYSFWKVVSTSIAVGLISGISANVMNNIKIPMINAGRGNFSAISKQIYTKFGRQLIKGITIKTFAKMFAVELYNSIADFVIGSLNKLLKYKANRI